MKSTKFIAVALVCASIGLVAQSQKRSAVFDALTNPTNVTVEVA